MRDAINSDEGARLVEAMKGGKDWDEVRGMIPGVDPEALDRGWKDYVHREAGVEFAPPAPEGSGEEPPVGDQPSGEGAEATVTAKPPKPARAPRAPRQAKPKP